MRFKKKNTEDTDSCQFAPEFQPFCKARFILDVYLDHDETEPSEKILKCLTV